MAEDGPRLTRRDALAALTAVGVAGVGSYALSRDGSDEESSRPAEDSGPLGPHEQEALVAIAHVVYPDPVEGIEEFVRTYAAGRADNRPERAQAMAEAIATLEDRADRAEGTRFAALSRERREELLVEMGVDVVDPDPDGIVAARLRYYLVNELLFALYASPTGGRLVGIENPQGYPGGIDSYQRGPEE